MRHAAPIKRPLHAAAREQARDLGEATHVAHHDRLAEGPALLGVVQRELVGRAGNAQGLRTDGRAARLERLHRGLALGSGALTGAREPLVELRRVRELDRERTGQDLAVFGDVFAGIFEAAARARVCDVLLPPPPG